MAASAAATECAALLAASAAYLNGLLAVRGRGRTAGAAASCRPEAAPALDSNAGPPWEASSIAQG